METCELCGSENNLHKASVHIENSEDDTLHGEAWVCLSCWCRYESNREMFLVILSRRIEEAEDLDV